MLLDRPPDVSHEAVWPSGSLNTLDTEEYNLHCSSTAYRVTWHSRSAGMTDDFTFVSQSFGSSPYNAAYTASCVRPYCLSLTNGKGPS